ncbi:MAG TPA: hypothetical protein VFK81_08785 [Terriglobales bacterium]|nr:hypothetical protein [Terriglobales bacterium]
MGAGWRLWLGLTVEVLGILVAVFSIGTGIMLVGLALGVLTVIVGLIQGFVLVQGSPRVVVTDADFPSRQLSECDHPAVVD